jgi:outer membrane protein assembly factor BamB
MELWRSGRNPKENTIGVSNVSQLQVLWTAKIGPITAQPVYASNINVQGTARNLLFLGSGDGAFYAFDADTGEVMWSIQLGTYIAPACSPTSGSWGIDSTATFDRRLNTVYTVNAWQGLYGLDMSTGKWNWANQIITNSNEHVFGALALSPKNNALYVPVSTFCLGVPYKGRVSSYDSSSLTHLSDLEATPGDGNTGGGVWGVGGVAFDTVYNDVYFATGDGEAPSKNALNADRVVHVDADLTTVRGTNAPPAPSGAESSAFWSTPMVAFAPSCWFLTIKRQTGEFLVYDVHNIDGGPKQTFQMVPVTSGHTFVGVSAWGPSSSIFGDTVYVTSHDSLGMFQAGLNAFRIEADCTLTYSWSHATGAPNAQDTYSSPSVANGVVYYGAGERQKVFAVDAKTGRELWNSGSLITGAIVSTPMINNGTLFVGTKSGNLYAFALR